MVSNSEGDILVFRFGGSSSSRRIERGLKRLRGVRDVTMNYVTGTVLVTYVPEEVSTEQIQAFLKNFGYDPEERL